MNQALTLPLPTASNVNPRTGVRGDFDHLYDTYFISTPPATQAQLMFQQATGQPGKTLEVTNMQGQGGQLPTGFSMTPKYVYFSIVPGKSVFAAVNIADLFGMMTTTTVQFFKNTSNAIHTSTLASALGISIPMTFQVGPESGFAYFPQPWYRGRQVITSSFNLGQNVGWNWTICHQQACPASLQGVGIMIDMWGPMSKKVNT